MEKLTFYQETERHTVNRHGVNVASDEESNHEVGTDDTHCSSEEPTFIEGDVVEQWRLEANLKSSSTSLVAGSTSNNPFMIMYLTAARAA
ncbi:hypothetical protein ACHAXS_007794 [Conticribra weissflogii]